VIAVTFFAPSEAQVMVQENDDLGFGGEMTIEDTGNLIKSFLVYGVGKVLFYSAVNLLSRLDHETH
jgi:hypothetical protein